MEIKVVRATGGTLAGDVLFMDIEEVKEETENV
jgi:hypothetical protein